MRYLSKFLLLFILILNLSGCGSHSASDINVVSDNAALNLELGNLFLAKNKLNKGVRTLPNGLQYLVSQEGQGIHPSINDEVSVNYQGQHINGQIFDSQHAQKNPILLKVSATIPAWQQALPLMKVGSTMILYVPPHLAYGEKGVPGLIGPNETVVYVIRLLAVNPRSGVL